MALTREQILNVNDIQTKEIPVPEWSGSIFIRQLTRGEQDAYLKRQMGDARVRTEKRGTGGEFGISSMFGHDAWVCAHGICDETGKTIFSEKDIEALKAKNGAVIGRIAQEIALYSGMAEDVPLEQEAKN